jgi:hypothetical protein
MDITRLNRRDILNYQRRRAEQREAAVIPFYKLEERRKVRQRGKLQAPRVQPGPVIVLSERLPDFDYPPGIA